LSSETAKTLVKLTSSNKIQLNDYILKIDKKYQGLDKEKKSLFSKEFNEILGNIYSAIEALSGGIPSDDKADFDKILLKLDRLYSKLDKVEDNIDKKIDEVKVRFENIKNNPKNEKDLEKIAEEIKKFENKLEEVKTYNSKITLSLLKSDLEKIESIMNKNKRPIWNIYCQTRFVVLGVIIIVPAITLFLI